MSKYEYRFFVGGECASGRGGAFDDFKPAEGLAWKQFPNTTCDDSAALFDQISLA